MNIKRKKQTFKGINISFATEIFGIAKQEHKNEF